jgi:hypothetical protein
MAKLTGLSSLWVGGHDVAGDIGAVRGVGGGPAMIDVSSIEANGHERLAGRFDGKIDFNAWLNPARAHLVFRNVPDTNTDAMLAIPATAGAIAAMLSARQVNYDPQVQNDLGASFAISALAATGHAVEFGKLITNGKRTDTGATATGTGIDLGLPFGVAAVTLTSASAANPTVCTTATAHGLQTGDSVLIAASDKSALNTGWTVTVTGADTFTVALDLTGGAASGGTVQRTSHHGWRAQLQLFTFTGTSVTVKLQDAPKNLSGSFADLTDGAFSAHASAPASERIASASGIVQRYVRVADTGTFSNAVFAAAISAKR